jgi:uncharacterized protein YjiS (DUF1127 family)
VSSLLARLRAGHLRRRDQRLLAEMNERLLQDIGLDRRRG